MRAPPVSPGGPGQAPRASPTARTISISSGKTPVWSFEYSSLPPTFSSKHPPLEGISSKRRIDRLYVGSNLAVRLTACGS